MLQCAQYIGEIARYLYATPVTRCSSYQYIFYLHIYLFISMLSIYLSQVRESALYPYDVRQRAEASDLAAVRNKVRRSYYLFI